MTVAGTSTWKSVGDFHLLGIAQNFNQPKPHRLSLDVGDTVVILKENGPWYYGYVQKRKCKRGIFPKSYIRLVECELIKGEYTIKHTEFVKETTTVLADWKDHFERLYLSKDEKFNKLRDKMLELIRLRSLILSGNLPVDELREVKLETTGVIDTGNHLLGLDMIVRDDLGDVLDIEKTSTTKLFAEHENASKRIAVNTNAKNRISNNLNQYSHNVLVEVHAFVCMIQEDSDLILALYNGETLKPITENYVVKWGHQGLAQDLDHFKNHRVLFTDLSKKDLESRKIFLVCQAVRIGAMEADPRRGSIARKHSSVLTNRQTSSASLEQLMRRPFGVAYFDLTAKVRNSGDFKIIDMPFILCERDNLETTLRKLVANSEKNRIESKLAVSVDVLNGDIKQIKEKHSKLAISRKMGFPKIILPGDVRNDLYLTLVSGEFTRGAKNSEKNIEVTTVVCNERGETVSGVMSMGAGAGVLDEYKSVIYYHEDRPKWVETFRIQLSIEEFKLCHLKFVFKHRSSNKDKDRSEKPFGIAYVRLLQPDGTTLQQREHKLRIYKIDHKKLKDDKDYMQLPSHVNEIGTNMKTGADGLTLLPKDSFVIETNLCSTKLTQNVDLLGLLNWSSNRKSLDASLEALINVPDNEVVKFLQDILDALFDILRVSGASVTPIDNAVFACLVRLIDIVSDAFRHFQSVLDVYINESFSAALAYKKLICIFKEYINVHMRNANDESLYKTVKNLPYIIKFIIRSRVLHANLEDNQDHDEFQKSLQSLLAAFVELTAADAIMLRSQGAVVKYLPNIAPDLMQVYNPSLLCNFIIDVIQKSRLVQSKRTCINDIVSSRLFRIGKCRAMLLPIFCQQINDKLMRNEEGDASDMRSHAISMEKAKRFLGVDNQLLFIYTSESSTNTKIHECLRILNNILDLIFAGSMDPAFGDTHDDISHIMNYLLESVIQMSFTMTKETPHSGNMVAVLLGILRSMTPDHYQQYVQKFSKNDLRDFIVKIFLLFANLVNTPVFPAEWMDMIMHQNTIILESLRQFKEIIMDNFSNPFVELVWSNFFYCSITFLTQPSLQLDKFGENKQSNILQRYKDIRGETASVIHSMWMNLDQHKTAFVPSLVGPVLEMSLIPDTKLRRATIPIFFDMMQCEYYSSKYACESYGDTKRNTSHCKMSFDDFEKEMIEKLDIMVEAGSGDEEYRVLFNEIMMKLCREHNTLRVKGEAFVNMVSGLLSRLLEYRCNINDESKENRMACTVSLLNFYYKANRSEMYIRYVAKLCGLHREFENYAEAAFSLKKHSDLLMWDDTLLSPNLRSDMHLKCQTHRELKEELYHEIMKLFTSGKMWECAIDICKELAAQYENVTFDYDQLSKTYDNLAELYRKIMSTPRYECEYFRVIFYGMSFPNFLRNKVFIYRGKEYERLSEFGDRMLAQHPSAGLLQNMDNPVDDIMQGENQLILINKVEPIMDQSTTLRRNRMSIEIAKYYQTNNVKQFQFSRPMKGKDGKGTDDGVGSLWLKRTTMTTSHALPGILRCSEVVDSECFIVKPLQYAIETMRRTNEEIRCLIHAHANDPLIPIHPLSMKIGGVIDAAVMGGLPKYEEAFLTPKYMEVNPNDAHEVEELKDLIADHIPLLEVGLKVHRLKMSPDLNQLQERWEELFRQRQPSLEKKYGKKNINDLRYDLESMVTMRRHTTITHLENNRHSETSMGSADSGLSKSTQGNRSQTSSSLKSPFNFNFNPTNLTRSSATSSPNSKGKSKDKSRRTSKVIRELSVPSSNSQWYTGATPQTPTNGLIELAVDAMSMPTSPVVELTEELTPQRPLRSEVERERRLSRPTSTITPTSSVKGMSMNLGDTHSLSGESSNRNSIVTTDSTASEDDNVPPPLPAKTRESSDYSNLPSLDSMSPPCVSVRVNRSVSMHSTHSGRYTHKPQPAEPTEQHPIIAAINSSYDMVETKVRPRPPTPPPKPSRNCKNSVNIEI